MINKLTVEQISELWDSIKYAVDAALPPIASGTIYRLSNILSSLMAGTMECWAVYEKDEDNNVVTLYAIILTIVSTDDGSGSKALFIYAMAAMADPIPRYYWKEGLEGLVKYAGGRGCERITAYTDLSSMEQLFQSVGGEARYTLLSLPIDNFDSRRL